MPKKHSNIMIHEITFSNNTQKKQKNKTTKFNPNLDSKTILSKIVSPHFSPDSLARLKKRTPPLSFTPPPPGSHVLKCQSLRMKEVPKDSPIFRRSCFFLAPKLTATKTKMTIEKTRFEDVSPIPDGDFPLTS